MRGDPVEARRLGRAGEAGGLMQRAHGFEPKRRSLTRRVVSPLPLTSRRRRLAREARGAMSVMALSSSRRCRSERRRATGDAEPMRFDCRERRSSARALRVRESERRAARLRRRR